MPTTKYGGIRNDDLYPNRQQSLVNISKKITPVGTLSDWRDRYEENGVSYSSSGMGRSSQYDDWILNAQPEDYNELRADRQSTLDKVGNGIGKAAIFAGTSFLRNSLGVLSGITQGNLNDNSFNQLMHKIETWADEVLPLYTGADERNRSWLGQTVGSMNWWMESLRSVGIMVGAGAGGGLWGRTFGMLNQVGHANSLTAQGDTMLSNLLTSFFASAGEAGMEGDEVKETVFNQQKELVESNFINDKNRIIEKYGSDSTPEAQKELAQAWQRYNDGIKEAQENSEKASSATFMSNVPMLMLENLYFFGKSITKGYKDAARLNGFANRTEVNGILGNYSGLSNLQKAGKIAGIVAGPLGEGNEEMLQNAIKKGSEMYYKHSQFSDSDDDEAKDTAGNFFNSVMESLKETYTDPEAYKEGLAGLLMGVTGGVQPRSPYNFRTKKWQAPFTLEGGLYQNIKEYKNIVKETEELANELNTITAGFGQQDEDSRMRAASSEKIDFLKTTREKEEDSVSSTDGQGTNANTVEQQTETNPNEDTSNQDGIIETTNYYKKFLNKVDNLQRIIKYRNEQRDALQRQDVFEYKNAEFAELFSHINTFARAGRLQDMKQMITSILNVDDPNVVADIINQTTKDITDEKTGITKKVGPYVQLDGSVNEEIVKEKLTKQRDYLLNQIDNYSEHIEAIQSQTNGMLDDKQVTELAYMRMALGNMHERSKNIVDNLSGNIQGIIDNSEWAIGQKEEDNKNILSLQSSQIESSKDHSDIDAKIKANEEQISALKDIISDLQNIQLATTDLDIKRAAHKALKNLIVADTVLRTSEQLLDPENSWNKTVSRVEDLIALSAAQIEYQNKFLEYINNPAKMQEDNKKQSKKKKKEKIEKNLNEFDDNLDKLLNSGITVSEGIKAIQQYEQKVRNETGVDTFDAHDGLREKYKDNALYKEINKTLLLSKALQDAVEGVDLSNIKWTEDGKNTAKNFAKKAVEEAASMIEKKADELLDLDNLTTTPSLMSAYKESSMEDLIAKILKQAIENVKNAESRMSNSEESKQQDENKKNEGRKHFGKVGDVVNIVNDELNLGYKGEYIKIVDSEKEGIWVPTDKLEFDDNGNPIIDPVLTDVIDDEEMEKFYITKKGQGFEEVEIDSESGQTSGNFTENEISEAGTVENGNNSGNYLKTQETKYHDKYLRENGKKIEITSPLAKILANQIDYDYINSGAIKPGDTTYFIIDNNFEQSLKDNSELKDFVNSETYKPTIFMAVFDKNNNSFHKIGILPAFDEFQPYAKNIQNFILGSSSYKKWNSSENKTSSIYIAQDPATNKPLTSNVYNQKRGVILFDSKEIHSANAIIKEDNPNIGIVIKNNGRLIHKNNPNYKGKSNLAESENFKGGPVLYKKMSDGTYITIPLGIKTVTSKGLKALKEQGFKTKRKDGSTVSLETQLNKLAEIADAVEKEFIPENTDNLADTFKDLWNTFFKSENNIYLHVNKRVKSNMQPNGKNSENDYALLFQIIKRDSDGTFSVLSSRRIEVYDSAEDIKKYLVKGILQGNIKNGERQFSVYYKIDGETIESNKENSKVLLEALSINTSSLEELNPEVRVSVPKKFIGDSYKPNTTINSTPSTQQPAVPTISDIENQEKDIKEGGKNDTSFITETEILQSLAKFNMPTGLIIKRVEILDDSFGIYYHYGNNINEIILINKSDLEKFKEGFTIESVLHARFIEKGQNLDIDENTVEYKNLEGKKGKKTLTRKDIKKVQSSALADILYQSNTNIPEFRKVNNTLNEQKTITKAEKDWLQKALPQAFKKLNIIKGLIESGDIKAWGMYKDSVITLSDKAAFGTIYHEAFHYVFDMSFTEEEKSEVLKEAEQLYGENMTESYYEEMLAEDFRQYMETRKPEGFGKKIINFFKRLFGLTKEFKTASPVLNDYFERIAKGNYATESFEYSTYKKSAGHAEQLMHEMGIPNEVIENMTEDELDYWRKCS